MTVSTAAATAAAAAAAELPLKGLLALNSRHLAPSTVIILDMGILGFFLAIRGLQGGAEGKPQVNRNECLLPLATCCRNSSSLGIHRWHNSWLQVAVDHWYMLHWKGSRNQNFLKEEIYNGARLNVPEIPVVFEQLIVQVKISIVIHLFYGNFSNKHTKKIPNFGESARSETLQLFLLQLQSSPENHF